MFLLFSILTISLKAASVFVNQNYTIIENELRIRSNINEAKQFCFNDTNLEDHTYYQVSTYYLGTKGMRVVLYWKQDETQMIDFVSNYQPLDSYRLTFFQEKQQNKQHCFYAIPFQIAKSIHQIPYPDGIEYYLQILKKQSADGDHKELYAYICVIGGGVAITFLIYLFQKNQEYRNKLD